MNILVLGISLITLIMFFVSNKRMSYLFIYFLSSCLYYSDSFFGYSFASSNNHISGKFYDIPVNFYTYIIVIINFLIILFSVFLVKKKNYEINNDDFYDKKRVIAEKYAIYSLILINIVLSIIPFSQAFLSIINQNYNKLNMLDSASGFINYFKVITTFLLIYIFTQNKVKYSKIVFILIYYCLFVTFILGHRSYAVISLIGILVFKMNDKIKKDKISLFQLFKKNLKLILLVVFLFFVFVVVKNIYTAFYNGNYELVLKRLKDFDYYINSFKLTEFNAIFVNLDTVVGHNYTFSLSNYIRPLLLIFPMLNRFINIESFSTTYQLELFAVNSRAGTFLGEAYSCGGIFLVPIIIILILIFLNFFDKKIYQSKSNLVRTFFIVSAVDFSFYIHRNCLEIAFLRIRSYLYVLILVGMLTMFFKRLVKE